MHTTTRLLPPLLCLFAFPPLAGAQNNTAPCPQPGCVQQQELVLTMEAKALLAETLASEFYARDFYQAAAERFTHRPFGNLARAEQNHADALTRVLESAGEKPVAKSAREVKLPESLAATLTHAEQIERDMIAAYDKLLNKIDNPVAAPILARIQSANRRHLAAATTPTPAKGRGRGQGRGQGLGQGRGQGRGKGGAGPCGACRPSCRR